MVWRGSGTTVLPDLSENCVVDGANAPPPLPIDSTSISFTVDTGEVSGINELTVSATVT